MMKRFFLLFVLLCAAAPAHAAIYVRPTWDNLLKTLVRYGALDLSEDRILDEYAVVTDCEIYKTFVGNDFRWNQVRETMRESIEMNLTKFPTGYVYEDKFALDHYDFKQQLFEFNNNNMIQKVNAFFLLRANAHLCGDTYLHFLPRAFRAVLDESVTLPGLPLTQRSADALLRRMDANNNKARFVYVRFNLHINYIGKVDKNQDPGSQDPVYVQTGARQEAPVILNSQIDTIDFYEDELHTKLLYSYQP